MPRSTNEQFLSNPQFGTRDYGRGGNPSLGRRDHDGLQAAFVDSEILNGKYDFAAAGRAMVAYAGENTDFPYYRRNFIPQSGDGEPSDVTYMGVRDKSTLTKEDIIANHLGSAWSPTIASPGVNNGLDANALRSVPGLLPAEVVTPESQALRNPSNTRYTNMDNTGANERKNVGTLRVFRLGVGSAAGNERLPR
jgi:hypothetical protein